jgi:hypothetical protein
LILGVPATKTGKSIRFCTFTATLGTPDTLVQHPASMTHSKVPKEQRELYGISDGLIRVSVGFEDIEDIISDFEQALRCNLVNCISIGSLKSTDIIKPYSLLFHYSMCPFSGKMSDVECLIYYKMMNGMGMTKEETEKLETGKSTKLLKPVSVA